MGVKLPRRGTTRLLTVLKSSFPELLLAVSLRMLAGQQRSKARLWESEERFQLAMRGAKDGLWDWNILTDEVYFSPRWKSMLGYEDHEIRNHFGEWRHLVHPDDLQRSLCTVQEHLEGNAEHYELEHRLRHKDGTYRWILARGASLRDASGRPYRMAGSHTDITDRKRSGEALQRRDAILEAVAYASERFLQTSLDWEESIQEVLKRLGQATEVDRIYIYENHLGLDGELLSSQRYEWAAPGIPPHRDNPHPQEAPWQASGFGRWRETLSQGGLIHGDVRDFPESERAALAAESVRSVAAVPIFVGLDWWGYIGFDECHTEKEWSATEMDALRSAASTLGAAIQHKQAEERLREKEQQYRSVFAATNDGLLLTDLNGVIVDVNPALSRMCGYTREEIIGASPRSLIQPDNYRRLPEYLRTVRAGGHFQTRAVHRRKDGTPFHVEVHGTRLTYMGSPHILVVVRDVTDQIQAYELLEQRVEERTRELTVLLEVSHNVASMLQLQPLLGMILDQLKPVVNYSGAAIHILEGDDLSLIGYRGPLPEEQVLQRDFKFPSHSANHEVAQLGRPVIIPDVQGDTPLALTYQRLAADQLTTTFGYVRSWLGAPLRTKERTVGVMSLAYEEPDYYTAQHVRLAMAIANQAAIAIENARLYEQAQSLAALTERQRLARELHDSVSQALYGIALGARTARTLLDRDPSMAAPPLDYVLSLAEAGLAEMRALIFELRPESLETEGLIAALSKQAASLRARHGIEVDIHMCEEPELPIEIKEEVYRIAQEAMHNTVKHARARRVRLHLDRAPEGLVLDVYDDGEGFDPAGEYPGQLGLRSMRERMARLHGALEIESSPGAGTHLHAHIPHPKPV